MYPSDETQDVLLPDTLPAPPPSAFSTPGPVTLSSPRDGLPIELLSRFQWVELLGKGGMGVVYRARDIKLDRDVAIKVLKNDAPACRRRLIREARAQARIDHPNVCRVYEVGEVGGEPYIVMQLVHGVPFRQVSCSMTLVQRLEILRLVADAVHAAHRLGLVHRDIKPGNILVEQHEDGTYLPYLVDFGLVRDLDRNTSTLGSEFGTPAYMAPEQVTGAGRIDTRVDVYGLGATLYEACVGQPPHGEDTPFRLLNRIAIEDPRPLRVHDKALPVAIEAIAMKCLERDPARRYGTALELAEDLGRYLEGEPIQARVVTPATLWWRRMRKHRALFILGAIGFLSAMVLLGAFLDTRRKAVEDRELARELGQEASAMELVLRNAYQMPLHDVERERRTVRERLVAFEQRMAERENVDRGTVEYALGRGRLALGELETARQHLENARQAGYALPELDYALAKTLLTMYDREQQRNARKQNKQAEEARRQEEFKASYQRPALVYLRAALPGRIEDPRYAEALLAFHDDRYADAITMAREAFVRSPLLYEAKRLEGDAHVRLAGLAQHEHKEGWWGRAKEQIEMGAEAYRVAEDMARSDPDLLLRECYLWTHAMYAASVASAPSGGYFEQARVVCARAVKADGASGDARLYLAELLALRVFALANNPEPDQDPLPLLAEAIQAAEAAVESQFETPRAREALANALRAKIILATFHDRDALDSIQRAMDIYEDLVRTGYRPAASLGALAFLYIFRMNQERWRGIDTQPTLEKGLRVLDDSIAAGAGLAMTHHKRSALFMERVYQLEGEGHSPLEAVEQADRALDAGRAMEPHWIGFPQVEANVHSARAAYEIVFGEDPRNSIARCTKASEAIMHASPDDATAGDSLGTALTLSAQYELGEGRNARPLLARARTLYEQAIKAGPWMLHVHVLLARVAVLEAQTARARNEASEATFQAIVGALGPWLAEDRANPEGYVVLAEGYALEAEWRKSRHEPFEVQVAKGLEAVNRALALNPKRRDTQVTWHRLQSMTQPK